jgi:hypothetical protein
VASDPGAVDAAVIAALRGDSELAALCPGGVYYGLASDGVENFVLIDRLTHEDNRNAFATAYGETFLYLVKAVMPGTSSSNGVRPAALRIRAVLDGNETLAPDGYRLQRPVEEVENIRLVEVDETNPDYRVQHWGGQYEVQVQRF